MDIVSKVGSKIQNKISSGDLNESDLLSEAQGMMGKLNNGDLFSKMMNQNQNNNNQDNNSQNNNSQNNNNQNNNNQNNNSQNNNSQNNINQTPEINDMLKNLPDMKNMVETMMQNMPENLKNNNVNDINNIENMKVDNNKLKLLRQKEK